MLKVREKRQANVKYTELGSLREQILPSLRSVSNTLLTELAKGTLCLYFEDIS